MAKRIETCGECGAAKSAHPNHNHYPCLDALKAVVVKVPCSWPGCEKKARKTGLGPESYCAAHRKAEFGGFMVICNLEGPSGLCRPLPTPEERKYAYETGKLPESRKTPITFKNTKMRCAECEGPLVMVNDPDWSSELPNALSARYDTPNSAGSARAWGIGICRVCSFKKQAVA
jgi:hypothetical protein